MLKWCMLAVYLILCSYVLWRFFCWTTGMRFVRKFWIRGIGVTLFCAAASTIFLGKFLPESGGQRLILQAGNYWLAFLIYLIFFLVLLDLVFLGRRLVRKLRRRAQNGGIEPMETVDVADGEGEGSQESPNRMKREAMRQRMKYLVCAGLVVVLSVGFTVYGAIHARQIKTAQYSLTIDKDGGKLDGLNLILIADLHLGYSIGSHDMEKMVDQINALNPDLIVLAGDIFDNDYDALDDPDHLEEVLRGLKSTYGVYAVFGNHDVKETLVAGFSISAAKNAYRDERMETFLEKSGIVLLEDRTELIADSFYLSGRLDGEKTGYGGNSERLPLEELTAGLDRTKPLLMISHEPDHLASYDENGVDLLLSGHTHAGQFFPLTIVQPFAWENYWGVCKVGSMYSVVTSGIGVYGPAIRVGTDSEILNVKLTFSGNQ